MSYFWFLWKFNLQSSEINLKSANPPGPNQLVKSPSLESGSTGVIDRHFIRIEKVWCGMLNWTNLARLSTSRNLFILVHFNKLSSEFWSFTKPDGFTGQPTWRWFSQTNVSHKIKTNWMLIDARPIYRLDSILFSTYPHRLQACTIEVLIT